MNYKKFYTLPLLLSFLSTPSFALTEENAPSDIKAWHIKQNSVKIAFKDNMELEEDGDTLDYEIAIYNANTGEQVAGAGLSDIPGTGNYLIKKLSGLEPGTEYRAQVYANYVSSGMDVNRIGSYESLHFKTKEANAQPIGGKPTELKLWNIKENSVKLSWRDNIGKGGYKINVLDENGDKVNGLDFFNRSSSRKYKMQEIRGLQAGTKYTATVISTTSGKQESDPIDFSTKKRATPVPATVGATGLHTWNIKSTSAMISFHNNHTDGSKDFEFVNVDTEESMTLNSKGIINVPHSKNKNTLIGKMIDLTPDTTYSIKITCDDMKESKIITFRTKK